ncbi:MAG: glutamate-5-semialdehyde dehydrogenase [Cyanobacteria bacterium J06641_5]
MVSTPPLSPDRDLVALAAGARQAARALAILPTTARNGALEAIARALEANAEAIVAANAADCEAAARDGVAPALQARLKLNATKLIGAIAGVRSVAALPDPLGAKQIQRELDEGLVLERIACPLGVIGVVFEARPDALIQIASLAIKSGNGVILKGGREATRSCKILTATIQAALQAEGSVNREAVQLLSTREEVRGLLALDDYIDLIVPRGSNSFVRFIQENTRIPVLGHADGICHLFVDRAADVEKAVAIAVDSKTQYPAACNAIETLLVHGEIAQQFLPAVDQGLSARQVAVRGDARARELVPSWTPTTDADWETEYGDLVLSVAIVDDFEAAIAHINRYSSGHTEAIATEDAATAEAFLARIDAAGVFHNCSTRFADGFRYGFGAEVGISTQQMPPRGPVGLEGLVTYKYQLRGNGHIVATYSGDNPQPFTHRDLL